MKHYLDAEGGCDGPSETRARPSSSQRAQPSKHRATSPYQVDAGRVVSGYWEPEEPSQLCRGVIAPARSMEILRSSAIRAERLGLRTRSAISAAAGTSAGNMDVVREGPLQPAPAVVGWAPPDRRREPGCGGYAHTSARQDCAVSRGISVVKTSPDPLDRQGVAAGADATSVSGVGDLRRFHRPALG